MKTSKAFKLPSGTIVPAGTELHFSNEGLGYYEGEEVQMDKVPSIAVEGENSDMIYVVVVGKAIKELMNEVKANKIAYKAIRDTAYELENTPKARMAIKMVRERCPREINVTMPKGSTEGQNVIETFDEFKGWLNALLMKMHGDKFDQAIADKMANDLNTKYNGDFGAMVGAVKSSTESKKYRPLPAIEARLPRVEAGDVITVQSAEDDEPSQKYLVVSPPFQLIDKTIMVIVAYERESLHQAYYEKGKWYFMSPYAMFDLDDL